MIYEKKKIIFDPKNLETEDCTLEQSFVHHEHILLLLANES